MNIFCQFSKGQMVPGLAKPEGWHPLAKMLTEIVKSGNPALQERAFALIVQLLALARPEGISESAGDLAQLTLAVIGQQQQCSNEVRESALHALKVLLEKVFLYSFLPCCDICGRLTITY